MKIILTAFALFLSACVGAQMRQMYLDTDENNTIRKIQFLTPAKGFVAFDKWIGYTQDSGRTFEKKYITLSNVNYNGYSVNLTFGFVINGVYAFNSNQLFVYGHYGFVPAILSSADGGNSFMLVYQGVFNINYLYRGVLDMYFSGTTGYAVSDDRILKTTNHGLSWSPVYGNATADFLHLDFFDSRNGIAVAQSKLVRTTDGGSTWNDITTPEGLVRSASFVDEERGWIATNGFVYKTVDGGSTWTKMNDENSLVGGNHIHFLNDSTGYLLGDTYNVQKTTDGGKYWERMSRNNSYVYLSFRHETMNFFDATHFWAGGGHGFLEMTTNGGGASVPYAHFIIDYNQLNTANTVSLLNKTKPGYQYKWLKNGVQFSTDYNASYVSERLGIDTIQMIVTNGSLSDTTEEIFDTRANTGYRCNPAFVQSIDTSSLQFATSDSTFGAKHTWYFGDGSEPFSGLRGTHVYKSVGYYTVKHVVKSAIYGCSDSSEQNITVVRTQNCLVLDFTYAADSFFTNRLTFKPTYSRQYEISDAAMLVRQWNWGDGQTGGSSHEYNSPGRYDVCLTGENYWTKCMSMVCKSVPVSFDTTCNADFVTGSGDFQNESAFIGKPLAHSSRIKNTWIVNNRMEVNTGHVGHFETHFFTYRYGEGRNFDAGNFTCGVYSKEISLDSLERTVTHVVYDSLTGCSDTVSKTFTISRQKNVFIHAVANPDFRQQYTFYAYELNSNGDTLLNGYSSRWRIDGPGGTYYAGGYGGESPSLKYTFYSPGYYTVAVASNRCVNYDVREVYYLPLYVEPDSCGILPPDFYTITDTTKPGIVQFWDQTLWTNDDLNNTFIWYFGDGDSSTSRQPIHVYKKSGTYSVTLFYKNPNGCSKQLTKQVSVTVAPCTVKANFEVANNIQATKPVAFTNKSVNGTNYQWDFGDGGTSHQVIPVHTFAQAGGYNVRLIASDSVCSDTVIKNLIVLPLPDTCALQPNFVFASDTGQSRKITFFSTSITTQNATATWNFDDGTSGSGLQVEHIYSQYGHYKVCLTIKDSICERVFCDSVVVMPSTQNGVAVFPNPLTDVLMAVFSLNNTEKTHLMIYSQSGLLVKQQTISGQTGNNTVTIDLRDVQPGLYILRIVPEDSPAMSIRFIKL